MSCFLTSRMDDPNTGELNTANRFAEELRLRLPNPCRALHICSDPDNRDIMDRYTSITRQMLENAGFRFERFDPLDGRNEKLAEKLVGGSDLLILAGGHVPTQNRFFQKISLRGLRIYEDIACSDSMGRTFYAIPDGSYLLIDGGKEELRGEAYRIKDGALSRISSRGDVLPL